MFQKIRSIIENNRGSRSIFWRLSVIIKDLLWHFSDSISKTLRNIKDKINHFINRNDLMFESLNLANDNVFDYKTQKILVDLDYSSYDQFGDMLHGYYRIGLVRALFPKSNITVKINKIFKNFYFKEANRTIYDFDKEDYKDFHIIYRHTYKTGAKRHMYVSLDHGLDYPLLRNPNDRNLIKNFEIHPDIYRFFPKLELRNLRITKYHAKKMFPKFFDYKKKVYINFRDAGVDSVKRNFKDETITHIIENLSLNNQNILFVIHSYRKLWSEKFSGFDNILIISDMDKKTLQKNSLKSGFFPLNTDIKRDEIVDFLIDNEIIYYLIENSNLFITSGNNGLGCFAQYSNPNMLVFVAEREINWITKTGKFYKFIKKEKYKDFKVNELIKECKDAIERCV